MDSYWCSMRAFLSSSSLIDISEFVLYVLYWAKINTNTNTNIVEMWVRVLRDPVVGMAGFNVWGLFHGIHCKKMSVYPRIFLASCFPYFDGTGSVKQEAFEKCWAHSPLRAAARPFTRCRYCGPPPLSDAACASMSTTTTTRDRWDRYGPMEWAQIWKTGHEISVDIRMFFHSACAGVSAWWAVMVRTRLWCDWCPSPRVMHVRAAVVFLSVARRLYQAYTRAQLFPSSRRSVVCGPWTVKVRSHRVRCVAVRCGAVWHRIRCGWTLELAKMSVQTVYVVQSDQTRLLCFRCSGPIVGPILWGHSVPLCHALSLSLLLSSLSWTSMRRRRATVATPGEWQCKSARSGEWAQHFSNASCLL